MNFDVNKRVLELFKSYDKKYGSNLSESWLQQSKEEKEKYLQKAEKM